MPLLTRFSSSCVGVAITLSVTTSSGQRLLSLSWAERERTRSCLFTEALRPPDLMRHFEHQCQFGPLLVRGQHITLFGRSKTTLWTQSELVERRIPRGLIDAALQGVFVFEDACFRRHQTQDDHFIGRQKAQRFKPASAF